MSAAMARPAAIKAPIARAPWSSRLRAMGIRDKPIAAGSPWQNGYAERLIGTIRRECVDHMIVFGEIHLRRILGEFQPTIIRCGFIDRWTRMPRSIARSSTSA
jgi:transposase InsO family protein